MTLKRYDLIANKSGEFDDKDGEDFLCWLTESDHGDYVEHDEAMLEIERLEARVAELAAERNEYFKRSVEAKVECEKYRVELQKALANKGGCYNGRR